jgi:hypothetical protein
MINIYVVLEVPQSGNYKKPIQIGWAFVLEQNGIEVIFASRLKSN